MLGSNVLPRISGANESGDEASNAGGGAQSGAQGDEGTQGNQGGPSAQGVVEKRTVLAPVSTLPTQNYVPQRVVEKRTVLAPVSTLPTENYAPQGGVGKQTVLAPLSTLPTGEYVLVNTAGTGVKVGGDVLLIKKEVFNNGVEGDIVEGEDEDEGDEDVENKKSWPNLAWEECFDVKGKSVWINRVTKKLVHSDPYE